MMGHEEVHGMTLFLSLVFHVTVFLLCFFLFCVFFFFFFYYVTA